ncbi:cytochrome-c peroxidase [Halovulum dunhuangense]|uniref:Cytochrome-c peroxidase n=1 Tax=Halovulum dunhuangense TaxID=1505036 RepID=A0A849KQM4_9RHOB|nr:cytochrome c peroxidase [Halovulum dunhuangense]NNU79159.1 cytochrome-c peroxidase [Halovulum dunhuangense]
MRYALLVALLVLALPALAGPPGPVTDDMFRPVDRREAELGQLLFYDPILSGNREVSCATCHHPRFGTSDGLSLGIGDGGKGLGPDRVADPDNLPEERIPRNAPALFNLGAHEFTVLFHDGRIEADPARKSGIRTPLEDDMTVGFDGILSAQTMFPVLSPDEMAGHYSENEIAQAVRQGRLTGEGGAWDLISARVRAIPDYEARFAAVYPDIAAGRPLGFTDISNAIAAFMELEWRSDASPFDAYLRGEGDLPPLAREGMALFYGDAGCGTCHSGPFLTDHRFHAMAAPQIGPGKVARFESDHRDMGRMEVTGRPEDAFAFRTPSLRNIALTAPYGHAGGHSQLGAFVRDHAEGAAALSRYNPENALLPDLAGVEDLAILNSPEEMQAITDAAGTRTQEPLSDAELAAILAFLDTLTDPNAETGVLGIPDAVPSGLPVTR